MNVPTGYVCKECDSNVYAKGLKFVECSRCKTKFLSKIFPQDVCCSKCSASLSICMRCENKMK